MTTATEDVPRPRYALMGALPGPLATHGEKIRSLVDLGYTDLNTVEADGSDAFTPLAMAAAWEPRLHLATAVVSAFTRAPACLAQTVAGVATASGGRFSVGIGSSSDVIVERWNGLRFEEPYRRVRDVVRFLREALSGVRVSRRYDTFEVDGFRLALELGEPPPVLLAALGEGMLRLAGREGDGVVLSLVAPDDVPKQVEVVATAAGGAHREVVVPILVCPSEDVATVRQRAKRYLTGYLTVPVYRAHQVRMGREAALAPVWERWDGGDRAGAVAAFPDEVVDALVVHGSPAACRERIADYVARGATVPAVSIQPFDPALGHWDAVRSLAPTAGS